jgi:hypothetical protein
MAQSTFTEGKFGFTANKIKRIFLKREENDE